MRLRDVGNPGKVVAIQANPMKVELRLLAPDPIWELSVRKGTEQTYASVHGTRVEQDRWYLVEFSARGLGTTHGEAGCGWTASSREKPMNAPRSPGSTGVTPRCTC
ncbi:hypothetical protein ACN28S_14010 [Cystobacter fuscus]